MNLIYRFNAIPIRIPASYFVDISKLIQVYMERQFIVVQSLSHVWLFETPWPAARQASLSFIISLNLLKLMSIELVMLSNCLTVWCLLLSIILSIRIFSSELAVRIRTKCWSFSFNISPSNEYSKLISFRIDWFDLLAVQDSQESSPAPQFESISSSALSLLHGPTLTSIHDYWKNPIALIIWTCFSKVMPMLFNMLSRFVIAFLPGSKHLNFMVAWFWSPRK